MLPLRSLPQPQVCRPSRAPKLRSTAAASTQAPSRKTPQLATRLTSADKLRVHRLSIARLHSRVQQHALLPMTQRSHQHQQH